jgi:hypothetical protein
VRPDFCRPALSRLSGQIAAQLARCPSVGDAHVGPDLGHDHLGHAAANPGDRVQPLHDRRKRAQHLLDLRGDGPDRLIEIVDVGQDLADEEGMVPAEPPRERRAQGRQLRAQRAPGELRQDRRVGRARHQRGEHRPARHAEDVARDAGELDARVLEHLVQPIGLADALLGERRPIAG